MLTENIMHNCIQRLLKDDQNPKMEDVECLCKLLTTIGQQLENPAFKAKASTNLTEVRVVTLIVLLESHSIGSV
jgi:hypothetical protein